MATYNGTSARLLSPRLTAESANERTTISPTLLRQHPSQGPVCKPVRKPWPASAVYRLKMGGRVLMHTPIRPYGLLLSDVP